MKKAIRLLTALIVLIFALACFSACDEKDNKVNVEDPEYQAHFLQEAKDNAIKDIESIVKSEEEYTPQEWELVSEQIETAKKEIAQCTNPNYDYGFEVRRAKGNIGYINDKKPLYNGFIGLGCMENLDAETELAIIEDAEGETVRDQRTIDYYIYRSSNPEKQYPLYCYGSYNGCVVIEYPHGWICGMPPYEYIIQGSTFIMHPGTIRVWKDNVLYDTNKLKDNDFLSADDLRQIRNQHKQLHPDFYEK